MTKLIKYYYDLMSQPSRALWIALKLGNMKYDDCPVALRKKEHLSEEFKKVNRFQKVPCLVDDDFHLSESVAMLRYMAEKGLISESLYPKELKSRSRVDEFLEWHHLGLRYGCANYFMHMWLLPINGLAHPPSEEKANKLLKEMENSLSVMENIWLDKSKFAIGDHMTVADLIGACEIEQTRLTKYDVKEKFPKTAEWIENIRQSANPHYDEAHKFIYKKSKM